MTPLGTGMLWFLFDVGSICFLFVERLATLEEWPRFAKNPNQWRMRKPGE